MQKVFFEGFRKACYFGVLLCLMFSLFGCEQFSAIIDYFKGEDAETLSGSSQPPVDVNAPLPANVLARVEQWTITVDEFEEKIEAVKQLVPGIDVNDGEVKKQILEELVNQQLIVLEAQETGLATKKEILDAIRDFKNTILVQESIKVLLGDTQVSEAEMQAFYEENPEWFVLPLELNIKEIIVEQEDQAKEIKKQLLDGKKFEALAKEHSISESAAQGGDIGFIASAPFPQMEKALYSLEIGDSSNVFKGPNGYYIVKLQEARGGDTVGLEEVKDKIKEHLMLTKQQEIMTSHIAQLKQKRNIKINEGLLK